MLALALGLEQDGRSLHRPAWNSIGTLPDRDTLDKGKLLPDLEGKKVYLLTTKAVYTNAQVMKVTRETIFVRYVKKVSPDRDNPGKWIVDWATDSVHKSDVRDCRVYQE